MNTDWLQTFVEVARQQSYSRAAEHLFLSQPTVYSHVKMLESSLGIGLVEQKGKRTELTTAGRDVLERAAHILEQILELRASVVDDPSLSHGTLTIGAASTFGSYLLPWLMGAFHERFPGIKLNARVVNDIDALDTLVDERQLDVVISPNANQAPRVLKMPLLNDSLRLITLTGHPLAGRTCVSPEDVASLPLVTRLGGAGLRHSIDIWFGEAGFAPTPVITLSSQEAMKTAVLAGVGVSLLSYCTVAPEVASGLLASVPLDPPLSRRWHVVVKDTVSPSHTLDAFVKLMRERTWLPPGLREVYSA